MIPKKSSGDHMGSTATKRQPGCAFILYGWTPVASTITRRVGCGGAGGDVRSLGSCGPSSVDFHSTCGNPTSLREHQAMKPRFPSTRLAAIVLGFAFSGCATGPFDTARSDQNQVPPNGPTENAFSIPSFSSVGQGGVGVGTDGVDVPHPPNPQR